jgi:tetratricopeptide (TPR) repeat protein
VAAIAPQIESVEQSKAARRRPESLSAYEIALRARARAFEALGKADRALLERSIREATEALAIDPDSVQALQALAYSYGELLLLQMAMDPEDALRRGQWAATRAIELDPTDALNYALRGLGVLRGRQFDLYADALADVRRAHEMNPNETEVLRVLAGLV